MSGSAHVYGFTGLDLERVRRLVERALEAEFTPHDSLYHGGTYYGLQEADIDLILQCNFDLFEKCPAEPDFPEAKVLLYLDGKERVESIAEQLRAYIPEITLLRCVTYS